MPEPGEKAGLPATGRCMECHIEVKKDSPTIQELAAYHKKREPIPWKRVYRVPEYVWFSHRAHVGKSRAACETCHGAVRDSDAIRKEKSTSMAACMECHKANGASLACDFCHEPR